MMVSIWEDREGQYFWKLDSLEEFEEAVYVVRMAKL